MKNSLRIYVLSFAIAFRNAGATEIGSFIENTLALMLSESMFAILIMHVIKVMSTFARN